MALSFNDIVCLDLHIKHAALLTIYHCHLRRGSSRQKSVNRPQHILTPECHPLYVLMMIGTCYEVPNKAHTHRLSDVSDTMSAGLVHAI